jgi:hypothetical protein
MIKPSINALGGVIAVVALGAMFYFGAEKPPTVSTVVAPAQEQVLKPPVVKPPVVEKSVIPPLVEKSRPHRRVLKGGKVDGKIDCKEVPEVAHHFTKDQVLAAAKEYGLSPAQISALRVCLN